MPIRRSLQVEGLKEARTMIGEVGDRARRPEPALRDKETLFDLQEGERRLFASGKGLRADSPAWKKRKRELGLSPQKMVATGRLKSALENANASEGVRATVFNGVLTWGIRRGQSNVYYAQPQAKQGRRVVVIDKPSRESIAERVERFVAYGVLH